MHALVPLGNTPRTVGVAGNPILLEIPTFELEILAIFEIIILNKTPLIVRHVMVPSTAMLQPIESQAQRASS